MKLLGLLVHASRRVLITAVVAGVISGAVSALLIALINLTLSRDGAAGWSMALSFGLLVLVGLTAHIVSQVLLNRLSQGAIYDLRMYLCERIMAAPLRNMEEVGAPRLLAALTDDVMVITNTLLNVPPFCINLATVVVCLIYLAWLSWVVLLSVVGFMAVGVAVYQVLMMRGLRSLRVAREEQDSMFKAFRALTEGFKELKLNRRRRDAFLTEVLNETASSFRKHNTTGTNFYIAAGSWAQLLFYIFIGLLLYVLPAVKQVDAQTLLGYTLMVLFIWGPLGGLLAVFPMIGRAKIAMKKIEALGVSLQDEAEPAAPTEAAAGRWQRLELAGVTHSYQREGEESRFTLGPIDLSFAAGETVFLVGGNGSGKTTLAKLLTGLYAPEAGEVRLDGEAVNDEGRERYRQLFSVVFSDFYLFEKLLGLESAGLDEKAREYLAAFLLAHKVSISGGVLSTTALSQGQRKRLALLTAYLEDRPFYVFDEWAADQDPVFRDLFYTRLLADLKSRGKTVLVITHDDRYFHIADRVCKLDYGRLVAPEPASILLPSPTEPMHHTAS